MLDSNPIGPSQSMIGKLLVASTTVQDPVLSRSVCLVVHQDTENVFAVLLNRPMTPPPGLAKMFDAGAFKESSSNQDDPNVKPEAAGTLPPGQSGAERLRQPFSQHPAAFPSHFPAKLDGIAKPPEEFAKPPEDKHQLAEQTAAEAAKTLGTIHFGGPLSGPVVAVHNSSEHAEAEAGKGVYVAAQRDLLERLVKQRPGAFRLIVGHLGWSIDQLHAERDAGYWHVIDATDEDVFTGDQDLWPSVVRRATTASMASWMGIPNTPLAAEVN